MSALSPDLLKDRYFRISKLHFNIYQIDHPNIKGQLKVITIPMNMLEVPTQFVPPQSVTPGLPTYAIGSQTLVGFSNRGAKGTPATRILQADELKSAKKVDITTYAQDSASEPWNEFVVEGNPPILVKLRTILTKLEWLPDFYNQFGDPMVTASTNVTNSVSVAATGEAGLT